MRSAFEDSVSCTISLSVFQELFVFSASSFPPCFKVFQVAPVQCLVLTVRQYQAQDFPRLLEIDQVCFVEGIAYCKEEMRYFLSMPTAISLVGLQGRDRRLYHCRPLSSPTGFAIHGQDHHH